MWKKQLKNKEIHQQKGSVALEYLIVTIFTLMVSVAILTYTHKLLKQKMTEAKDYFEESSSELFSKNMREMDD